MIASITFACTNCLLRIEVPSRNVNMASKDLSSLGWIIRSEVAGSDHYCPACRPGQESRERNRAALVRAEKGGVAG